MEKSVSALNVFWKLEQRLSESQVFARELVDRPAAHQLHSSLNLGAHQPQGAFNACLTRRGERKEIVTSNTHRLGAARKRLQNMRSALYPSIHYHVDSVTDRIYNF